MDQDDALEGHSRARRGTGAGNRLPPERGSDRGEQLHQGTGSDARQDHAGSRRGGRRPLRIPRTGVAGTQEHERKGPGKGRVRARYAGEDRTGAARQPPGSVAGGQSSYIRERARTLGMTMRDLAERAGVSYGHLIQVPRGRRNMGVAVKARIEAALEGLAEVASAHSARVDPQALWERMNAHDISQNEVAWRAGISSGYLSQIMSGRRSPSSGALKRLRGAPFQLAREERVMPAEVLVLGWSKGERSGPVVRSAGGPGRGEGGGAVRTGGLVPRGRRWTLRSGRATTAGGGCRWSMWSHRTAPSCSRGRMGLRRSLLRIRLSGLCPQSKLRGLTEGRWHRSVSGAIPLAARACCPVCVSGGATPCRREVCGPFCV